MNSCKMFGVIGVVSLILGTTVLIHVAGHTNETDPSSQVPTKLAFDAPTIAFGREGSVTGAAYLTTASGVGIGNATLHAQTLEGGTDWTTFLDVTTGADGHISFTFTPTSPPPGSNYRIVNTYRVTYDGDSQYAPTVSNEITMYVRWEPVIIKW